MADSSLDKLRRRVQSLAARKEAAEKKQLDTASAEATRLMREATPRTAWKYQKAPDTYFRTDLAVLTIVALVILFFVGIEQTLQHTNWFRLSTYGWTTAVLVSILLVGWLAHATWRWRLPFAVEGDTTIGGYDPSMGGDGSYRYDPWINVRVTITLTQGGTHEAVGHAFALLALRDHKFDLRVDGNEAVGRVSYSFYTEYIWKKWLIEDLRLVHRVASIREVRLDARYSGDGIRTEKVEAGSY